MIMPKSENYKKNSMVWVRARTIQPSDRRLSAKWLPTFADRGCHVVSVTDPNGRILGFLGRSRYFSIK
jgi:CBS-domain-containing membrane protein